MAIIHESNRSITIIVPALNEQGVVRQVLEDIHQVVATHFSSFELIAVNDGSKDGTGVIMDDFAMMHPHARVLHNPTNIGLGASFQRGLLDAKCSYVMLLCGDGGLPARSLPAIFEQVGKADLVIPYMVNLKRIKTPMRYMLSRTYANLLNHTFGFRLNYYNGLPVYPRRLLEAITITSSGFGFQGEILVKLLKSGCTYVEVGVDGAEETGRSAALRWRNIISVARTFVHLIAEIIRFKPIAPEVIARARSEK